MKSKKLIKKAAMKTWKFSSVYCAFFKRNKIIYDSPYFVKKKLTKNEEKEYLDYWKAVSPIVNLKTVEITKSVSGIFDKRIVPEEFLPLYIEPSLNNDKRVAFLGNKSIYNKWFGRGIFPKDFFHKLNNSYYSYDFEVIEDINKFIENEITSKDFPIVIKPNKDTYGGKNIHFVNNKEQMKQIIQLYPNLVVQEKLHQSQLIDAFNEESVNSVRVCIYRDNKNVLHVVNASIRMGVNGSLDNLSDGGIVCNIKPDGMLNVYANDRYAKKFFKHPDSGFIFDNKKFPLYNDMIDTSIKVAKNIIDARLISLDMALDANNIWRCIEINLGGQTILFAQYAGEPFLGEYTDEVIRNLQSK
ncbi:sugar-transfer associated ATP-grasp domain-containing protein [uncultured Psychrobacter sp.]|uniref:sugar-transfer associated ATP-grasp domain-containing protein n=1 Tax=uncultured Psychrobacter sp. TaxID=259303 RepID=UPI002616675D|nr:sugar-transfer associated ATP-grasp domain-containing protein [uncultured Psychrobacter sp.]